jgi:hypothetical protein
LPFAGICAETIDMIASIMLFISWMVLLICLGVHLSTFFGFDPIDRIPGVMFMHLVVMVLMFVSMFLLNGHEPGALKNITKSRMWRASPRWMHGALAASFIYALINFGLFMSLSEGGGPSRQGKAYVLSSHGRTIRTLTEQEFHQQQAYVVRGFSGHWILFSVAMVTLWTGAGRDMRDFVAPAPASPRPTINDVESAHARLNAHPPSPARAWGCMGIWLVMAGIALWGRGSLNLLAVPVLAVAAAGWIRRQSLRSQAGQANGMETGLGCLLTIPSALLGYGIAWRAALTLAIICQVGWMAALRGDVSVVDSTKHLLSDGTILNGRLWGAVVMLGSFLLWAVTSSGMIGLAERAGRSLRRFAA